VHHASAIMCCNVAVMLVSAIDMQGPAKQDCPKHLQTASLTEAGTSVGRTLTKPNNKAESRNHVGKSAPLLGQTDDVLDVLVAHAASVGVAAALGVAQDGQHAVGIPQAE